MSARMNEYLRVQQRLDRLFNSIDIGTLPDEMQEHWPRYLCVLVSGWIEIAVQELFTEYCRRRSDTRLHRFEQRHFSKVYNCKLGKVLDLAELFDDDWKEQLARDTAGPVKEAVNAIVTNKNKIAHGKPDNISFIRIRDYYADAKKLIAMLETHLLS
ncbi:hypothetical protein IIA79_07295 [bacterium]|nr:hypothetical protein [bacterium]